MLLSFQQMLVRLLFAAALGAAIGVEREFRRRPAGIRTSMFVCMATALFTMLSGQIAHMWGDSSTTRIASNIVQGIGFLGAGAIMKEGGGLLGMTTAATIFVEAAIGMAVGGGLYALAGSAALIVLFGLLVLGWCSQMLNLKARMLLFRFTTSHAESVAGEVQRLLAPAHLDQEDQANRSQQQRPDKLEPERRSGLNGGRKRSCLKEAAHDTGTVLKDAAKGAVSGAKEGMAKVDDNHHPDGSTTTTTTTTTVETKKH